MMFSWLRGPAALVVAGFLPAFAPVSSADAADDLAASCTGRGADICDFTAGGEGVHRIELALPAAQANRLREVIVSGQPCPLARQGVDATDAGVHLACFAYLTGGITYKMAVPAEAVVHVVKASPAHGEPITLIP